MTKWHRNLLAWFNANRREMPWRDDPSAYKVWISEIMLQQTQVATVIPYFNRFIEQFPDVFTLAQAPQSDVLKAWEGLGYYSRARNLHRAAQSIVSERAGQFPTISQDWKSLPGIGDYTAAAIASIVNGEPSPSIDGNVLRVWSRMRGSHENIALPRTRDKAAEFLTRHIKASNPSHFNQALMELGALVCRPRNPDCANCPLHHACIARQKGLTDQLPVKQSKITVKHRHEAVLILRFQDKVLLTQQPQEGLLGGLWTFPTFELPESTSSIDCIENQLGAWNCDHSPIKHGGSFNHAYTHFKLKLEAVLARTESPNCCPDNMQWVPIKQLSDFPLARIHRIIATKLL